jgi:hypothetical protein
VATPLIALAVAALLSAGLMGRGVMRGASVKILELGSLVLFGVLTLYTIVAHPAWSIAGVSLAVNCGLTAIVLISLAIGRPFTLQYAREQTPREFWNHPVFLRTNMVITAVWAVYFVISCLCNAAAIGVPSIPVWLETVVSIGALIGAIYFSSWYPARVRRNIPPRAAGAHS